MGLQNWQKLLSRLGLVLPSLLGLQALIVTLLMLVGLFPFDLAEISAAQWASVWLGSASTTALILIRGVSFGRSEGAPRGGSSSLPAVVPIGISHEGVVLASGRHFIAVGFVTLASGWNAREGRAILDTLLKAKEGVLLTLARTFDDQEHVYLTVPRIGATRESALEGVRRATLTIHRALEEQGVGAWRVADELGVEQLYWLCVLGKAIHEDVQLRAEARLVTARVGSNPPRLLATFALRPERFEQLHGNRDANGLVRVTEGGHPFFLVISLTPIPPDIVARRLRRLAARAPEMTLLAEALGETATAQAYMESQSSAMAEAALLLKGRKEGLWQTSYRLICAVADAPLVTENIPFTPHLLTGSGFAETATTRLGSSEHLLATSSLLTLIGQPRRGRLQQRKRARGTQEELDVEED